MSDNPVSNRIYTTLEDAIEFLGRESLVKSLNEFCSKNYSDELLKKSKLIRLIKVFDSKITKCQEDSRLKYWLDKFERIRLSENPDDIANRDDKLKDELIEFIVEENKLSENSEIEQPIREKIIHELSLLELENLDLIKHRKQIIAEFTNISKKITKLRDSIFNKIFETHFLRATEVEFRAGYKVFNQIILEEYNSLEIFDDLDFSEIKRIEFLEILDLVIAGKWDQKSDLQAQFEVRKQFRGEISKRIREKLHHKEDDNCQPTAICFSGGGIRSATFGLGVIQSLARHGLLDKFTYLSTVSGGGFLGSWLSAWIFRINDNAANFSNDNIRQVQTELDAQTAQLPEPVEVTHLRTFSNYMSPRLGLLSADTWVLVAIYLRNLLLNWTVLIPLIAAILLLPKLFVSFLNVLNINYKGEYQFVFWSLAIFAGIFAVSTVNALRPSLSRYSWIDQRYKVDEIGVAKSVEFKIIRWTIVPILILSFSLTSLWFWVSFSNKDRPHLPLTDAIASLLSTTNFELIDFMLLGVILFLFGYFLSWLIMFPKFRKDKKKLSSSFNGFRSFYKTYLIELIFSIISGMVGGGLLYLVVDKILPLFPTDNINQWYVCFGVPLFLTVFLLAATIFTGFAVRFTSDEDREWMARFAAWFLMIIVGWTFISSAVIFGPLIFGINFSDEWAWLYKTGLGAIGGFAGLITLFLGFFSKTSASDGDKESKGTIDSVLAFLPTVAAPISLVFLIILISYLTGLLTDYFKFSDTLNQTIWFLLLALIGIVMGRFININKFSFHSTYRERLIRAYLGASRTKERMMSANSFTGLDTEKDNIEMTCLKQKPFHILNMTLNLVNGSNLRWQNRKAESFTATALHCGSSNMGEGSGIYRSSESYGFNPQNNQAITLGTAAAISGAAASPNMGYYTMGTAVSLLMVLFNIRLGWWLGNPGKRGDDTYKLASPKWSPTVFLTEGFGLTNDERKYVYLADGGQFENLGLYEMVLRRCKTIIVCDGGADPKFTFFDLGSAIHKIQVDFGIPIDFADSSPKKEQNCAIATIYYDAVDGKTAENGTLIYIKPTLDKNQPIDITQYQSQNKDFPHETTADQFFSETQFESYRKLGFEMMNSISGKNQLTKVSDLIATAKEYLAKMEADKTKD